MTRVLFAVILDGLDVEAQPAIEKLTSASILLIVAPIRYRYFKLAPNHQTLNAVA